MAGKKKIQGRTLWTGSILAALVAAVAVFGAMLQAEKTVLTRYEKGIIYVAAKEIPKGQNLTEENMEEFLEQKELDVGCIPKTAVSSREQIRDLTALERIEPGVLITTGMFRTRDQITDKMAEPVIAGFKADDLYQVAGGVLRTGDRIHIYYEDEEGTVRLKWSDVFVQQVFDASGRTIGNEDRATSASRINIYLDKADVEPFYTDLKTGSLKVVKVCG
ncbi:MAG: SAF domain-containing protein [Lachnospiraceae bacterium]|nr:SAF domain-containing protein [Lachnospiraceae bacterium]